MKEMKVLDRDAYVVGAAHVLLLRESLQTHGRSA